MSARLTFHIVYVPGSVRYLLPFASRLLRWSDCAFRLVANGCTDVEQAMLCDFCGRDPRLELLVLPTGRTLSHWEALNYLQARTREERFCFMDSDILATGPFMADITPQLVTHAGVFAGAPLWCRPGDQVLRPGMDVVCGEHNRTEAGLPLGGTFFAVYDNRILTDFIQATGIGFEMRGGEDIPSEMRPWLAAQGLAGERYWFDTGKTLNLGLLRQGQTLAVLDSPYLYHLGGLSFIARRNWYDAQRGLRGRWGAFYRAVRATYVGLRRWARQDPVYRSSKMPFGRRRRRYGPYFTDLLSAMLNGEEPPRLPAEEDPDVRQRARAAAEEIALLWREERSAGASGLRSEEGAR